MDNIQDIGNLLDRQASEQDKKQIPDEDKPKINILAKWSPETLDVNEFIPFKISFRAIEMERYCNYFNWFVEDEEKKKWPKVWKKLQKQIRKEREERTVCEREEKRILKIQKTKKQLADSNLKWLLKSNDALPTTAKVIAEQKLKTSGTNRRKKLKRTLRNTVIVSDQLHKVSSDIRHVKKVKVKGYSYERVLEILTRFSQPLTANDIAHFANVPNANIGQIITRLKKLGYQIETVIHTNVKGKLYKLKRKSLLVKNLLDKNTAATQIRNLLLKNPYKELGLKYICNELNITAAHFWGAIRILIDQGYKIKNDGNGRRAKFILK